MDQQKTGAFICLLRKEKGLTQRELAEALNVTDKAVSKWERGQSYPDITILSALAELLGVTEREILQGEREGAQAPIPTEIVVRDTLDYAQKATRQRTGRAAAIAITLYTAALLVGAFVCTLCDVLTAGGFTWSLVVLAACLLAWGAVAPFYFVKKHKLFWSAAAVTALLPLLLLAAATVDAHSALWFPQPALLLAGMWGALGWLAVLLHTFTRMNKWYIAGIVIFLCAPANWLTNAICNGWIESGMDSISIVSTVSSGVLVVIVGAIVTCIGKRRRSK